MKAAVAVKPDTPAVEVPFFRAELGEAEIAEVVAVLRSGWLTTGSRVKRFEEEFARAVGANHAIALNSCTAALHLALEALGLKAGQAVLVPTLTFAATAEVVRYFGAIPVLVDCDPHSGNMDMSDSARKLELSNSGGLPTQSAEVVGMIPVHVGGLMMDVDRISEFAKANKLWVVEDAAHAFPASWRNDTDSPWQRCGENTAAVTCFSFYANKTITTGEGGMAVTADAELSERIRRMSLHGLSKDAWSRYSKNGSFDYRIVAPGFKYNLTDIAAAIGIHQLSRAESMRLQRQKIAERYNDELRESELLEIPANSPDRIHSWHLYPVKLNLDRLKTDRDQIFYELAEAGVRCSVHWRPLHLHPYYQETFGWKPEHLPVASRIWQQLISLPIFPGMRDSEQDHVISVLLKTLRRNSR